MKLKTWKNIHKRLCPAQPRDIAFQLRDDVRTFGAQRVGEYAELTEADLRNTICFRIYANGALAGFVALERSLGVEQGRIVRLYLAPDQRGQGIASFAVRELRADKADIPTRLPDVIEFFKRQGFMAMHRQPYPKSLLCMGKAGL